jgi:hypothetical protein
MIGTRTPDEIAGLRRVRLQPEASGFVNAAIRVKLSRRKQKQTIERD